MQSPLEQGPAVPELTCLQHQAVALASMEGTERSWRSPICLSSEARWRCAKPQPEGTWSDSQQWVEAFSCGARGAKSVCSMAKRPCAPWKRVCCCCGEQGCSVLHTGPACSASAGSSCDTGHPWPEAAHSRGSFSSAQVGHRAWQFTLTVLLVVIATLGMCLWGNWLLGQP